MHDACVYEHTHTHTHTHMHMHSLSRSDTHTHTQHHNLSHCLSVSHTHTHKHTHTIHTSLIRTSAKSVHTTWRRTAPSAWPMWLTVGSSSIIYKTIRKLEMMHMLSPSTCLLTGQGLTKMAFILISDKLSFMSPRWPNGKGTELNWA